MVKKLHWRFWRKNSNRYFEMENKDIPISQYCFLNKDGKLRTTILLRNIPSTTEFTLKTILDLLLMGKTSV